MIDSDGKRLLKRPITSVTLIESPCFLGSLSLTLPHYSLFSSIFLSSLFFLCLFFDSPTNYVPIKVATGKRVHCRAGF